jgi:hypothetical protein
MLTSFFSKSIYWFGKLENLVGQISEGRWPWKNQLPRQGIGKKMALSAFAENRT